MNCQATVLREKQLPACSTHGLLWFMLMWHKWEKGVCVLTWALPFWRAALDLPFCPNSIKFWNALCPLIIPCNNHAFSVLLSYIHHNGIKDDVAGHRISTPILTHTWKPDDCDPTSCSSSHLREKEKKCQCWTLENPPKILSCLSIIVPYNFPAFPGLPKPCCSQHISWENLFLLYRTGKLMPCTNCKPGLRIIRGAMTNSCIRLT